MGKPEDLESTMTTTTTNNFKKLVGYKNFIRANPKSDHFPVLSFHHIEFYCSDSTTTSSRFSFSLGMPLTSKSDLSTGNTTCSSHLLSSHSLHFLFTAPYNTSPTLVTTPSPIPSFNQEFANKFIEKHGLAVRAIALLVPSATHAYEVSVSKGAVPSFPPTDLTDGYSLSEVQLYGDVVLRFVSVPDRPTCRFLPGFSNMVSELSSRLDYGLVALDHAVGNVPDLASALAYVAGFTGFHEFAEFTAEDVGTAESGLNSMVLANNEENVLIPMNEPVHGTKRRSQIQTYLEYNGGAGLQHLALRSENVIATMRKMKALEGMGGFDFMEGPPKTYYEGVRRRAGDVLTEEQIKACEEMGLLVDRDDQGVLIQIFTKPIGDRPTIFLEIIQRIGCMIKDEQGKEYQKGGCGGFGKGNFAELFKAIEDYEKTLEAKNQTNAVPTS